MFNNNINAGRTDTRQLIAWYKLDQDGRDSSGNGHHLASVGSVPHSVVAGKRCAGPFGGNSHFAAPASLMAALTASTTALTCEYSYYQFAGGDYSLFVSNSGGDEWGAIVQQTFNRLWWRHDGPGIFTINGAPLNKWQNIAMVGFDSTLQMFVNGKQQPGTELIVGGDWKFNTATTFLIGQRSASVSPFSGGYLANIKFWKSIQNDRTLPTVT